MNEAGAPLDSKGRAVSILAAVVGLIALLVVGTALWRLQGATAGLEISRERAGDIPVTLFRPAGGRPAPVVVIAHGFAGSQQLMQPYAVTLARNGYLALTFDFPGHGANPAPFVSRIEDQERRVRLLLGTLESVMDFATGLPDAGGRVALLGHSMAGDVLTRLAAARRDQVAATVLVSPYLAKDAPIKDARNLLILFGALEPQMLYQMSREALAATTGGTLDVGATYGRLAEGDARRLELVPGVEHIGVLYGGPGIEAALRWLNGTFDRSGDGFIDRRGP
ncbi:MAG: alpha/beta hydrolase, partial [Bdellovibrio bacteriovorus]